MKTASQHRCVIALLAAQLLTGCGGPSEPPALPREGPRITLPTIRPASEAFLPDSATVVGVVVEGKARAYALQALRPMTNHFVNDLVGRTPVSVTYCPRTGCVRAFTGDGSAPLSVVVEGYQDGLLLRSGDNLFDQKTGRSLTPGQVPPVRRLTCEETTWGEWKKTHPDSDVFEGG